MSHRAIFLEMQELYDRIAERVGTSMQELHAQLKDMHNTNVLPDAQQARSGHFNQQESSSMGRNGASGPNSISHLQVQSSLVHRCAHNLENMFVPPFTTYDKTHYGFAASSYVRGAKMQLSGEVARLAERCGLFHTTVNTPALCL